MGKRRTTAELLASDGVESGDGRDTRPAAVVRDAHPSGKPPARRLWAGRAVTCDQWDSSRTPGLSGALHNARLAPKPCCMDAQRLRVAV